MTDPTSALWLSSQKLAAWIRFASLLEILPGALDAQLRKDSELTHFDYRVLVFLSESDGHRLRMTSLAQFTNSTLPRLSHVVRRLEDQGLVVRTPCEDDGRATNATLTEAGHQKVAAAAPGHVAAVRSLVMDSLDDRDVADLTRITEKILRSADSDGALRPVYERHDDQSTPTPPVEPPTTPPRGE
ncbi:MarR family winged helix-turn-helix transcriptional regulator [Corynebacterium sputi]|uniref:MarR family winged helix-turn-helix transcriptional regulator n=1 Tax=Corynebacterium sputi TaxID=489915 RepID=UPI000409345E|nr:MarR family transcriptional regulator [Corynebacterium sputi]